MIPTGRKHYFFLFKILRDILSENNTTHLLLCYDTDALFFCTVNLDEVQLMKLILAPESMSGLSESFVFMFPIDLG